MKKVSVSILSLLLALTIFLPSASAHHWGYQKTWSGSNSTWWSACTGVGNANHSKTLWINTYNGPTMLYLYGHEVWVNTTSKLPYAYNVSFMKTLRYYDESNNNLGQIGDHQWDINSMEHTLIMGGGWTWSYGHNDSQIWSNQYENIKLEYETSARIVASCEGFNSVFLGTSSTSTDVISNNASLLNTNENSVERNKELLETENIKSGIKHKHQIMEELRNKNLNIKFGSEEFVLQPTNDKINKWVERIVIDLTSANKSIDNYEKLLSDAAANAFRHEAILLLADKYDIKIDKSELHETINNLKQQTMNTDSGLKLVNKIVEALGLNDIDELFFDYDYDHHVINYIWTKLEPIYSSKYPQKENEDSNEYRNRLLEIFYKEIDSIMESFSINIV